MKLSECRKTILEIWRSPTRVLRRVNSGTIRATNSERFSPTNKLDPTDYFKKPPSKNI